MSNTLGLYPNTIIGSDEKQLCFTILNSASHILLNIAAEQYAIEGNTITFHSDCVISNEDISTLINSGYAYRLLRRPQITPESYVHSYAVKDDDNLDKVLCRLFTITFVLDKIPALPELHYPFLSSNSFHFTDDVLKTDRIKEIISKIQYVRCVRLLSNDILNSDVPLLAELRGYDLETIVNQEYYLTHLEEILDYPSKLKFIVYIDDISHFDESKCIRSNDRTNISYFCRIRDHSELMALSKYNGHIIPFPSLNSSAELIHSMLDYSMEDLLETTTTEQDLLLKNTVNPLFYGKILVDNTGNIKPYPFTDCNDNEGKGTKNELIQLKDNPYWHMTRSDFFEKCRNCALLGLCPPLSIFEINLRQTFCVKKR